MTCALCGSKNVRPIEWRGPSGVVLDGIREYEEQSGLLCLNCGGIEERR
jgi:hypothetical protein